MGNEAVRKQPERQPCTQDADYHVYTLNSKSTASRHHHIFFLDLFLFWMKEQKKYKRMSVATMRGFFFHCEAKSKSDVLVRGWF